MREEERERFSPPTSIAPKEGKRKFFSTFVRQFSRTTHYERQAYPLSILSDGTWKRRKELSIHLLPLIEPEGR